MHKSLNGKKPYLAVFHLHSNAKLCGNGSIEGNAFMKGLLSVHLSRGFVSSFFVLGQKTRPGLFCQYHTPVLKLICSELHSKIMHRCGKSSESLCSIQWNKIKISRDQLFKLYCHFRLPIKWVPYKKRRDWKNNHAKEVKVYIKSLPFPVLNSSIFQGQWN